MTKPSEEILCNTSLDMNLFSCKVIDVDAIEQLTRQTQAGAHIKEEHVNISYTMRVLVDSNAQGQSPRGSESTKQSCPSCIIYLDSALQFEEKQIWLLVIVRTIYCFKLL